MTTRLELLIKAARADLVRDLGDNGLAESDTFDSWVLDKLAELYVLVRAEIQVVAREPHDAVRDALRGALQGQPAGDGLVFSEVKPK